MSMEGVRILKLRTFEGSGFLGKVIYLPYGSNNKLLRMEAKCPMRFGGLWGPTLLLRRGLWLVVGPSRGATQIHGP